MDQTLPSELVQKIDHARCMSARPLKKRFAEPATVAETLHGHATRQPDALYLTYLAEDGAIRRYTYAQFYSKVKRLAAMLQTFAGVERGERIATAMHNHDDSIAICFAAWHLGACVVPLNMSEEDKRLDYVLEHSGVKAVFVLKEYAERIRNLLRARPSPPTPLPGGERECRGGIQYLFHVDGVPETEARSQPEEVALGSVLPPVDVPQFEKPEGVSPEDEALIVYTSGTTGVPKGVVLSQYALVADAHAITEWHGLSNTTRMMCVLPVHHVNGLEVTHVTPMFCGGSVVLKRKFSASGFFETINKYQIEIVSVVPTLLQFLIDAHAKSPAPPSAPTLRYVICGAGPLTVDLAARFEERFGIPICHGYGLSESTCYSCFVPVPPPPQEGASAHATWNCEHREWMRDHGYPSIGVPVATNEMAIHDDNGKEVGEGIKGEIVIRGHNVMLGYYANPKANENAFTHGWFRSGDEGFFRYGPPLKPNGEKAKYFFISGRFKELIIRGGVKISPLEVDEVLNKIPGVKAAMAVGFDSTTYGEEVGAYVVKLPDAKLTEEDVLNVARSMLPAWMAPKVVVFGETFPVTSTGKYQRNQLKPQFAKWKDQQFR